MSASVVARRSGISPEDYLRLDAGAPFKSEWLRGEMYAMAGGTLEHSLITANCVRELGNALKGRPCRVFESNLRVKTGGPTLYSYPDAMVICGPAERPPEDRHTVTNPVLVVEVLSPSTAAYDLSTKFACYRELTAMREYVVVSSTEMHVQTFYRRDDGIWEAGFAVGHGAEIRLQSIGVTLPLVEVYAGVEFPPSNPPPAAGDEEVRRAR